VEQDIEQRPAQAKGIILPAGLPLTPTQALSGAFVLGPALTAQHAARRASPGASARDGAEQFRQGFRIGDLCLMVRYQDGSELTEMPPVYRLPNAPDWFCGIANLHGMLTPVFDLSRYLGVAPDPRAKRMLLVLSHGADAGGVVIDGLPERLRWSDAQVSDAATAPARLAGAVQRAVLIGERLHFDLDCASLLQTLERSLESLH
jgi:purine-binding chemotaxis protein CheW